MPASSNVISAVLNGGGKLTFRRLDGKVYFNNTLGQDSVVDSQNKSFNLTASNSEVLLQEVALKSGEGTAILYDDAHATYGYSAVGGWLYSDSFSGCVFYLYRALNQRVYGVHAARASGKLADPSDFFRAAGAKLLYRFDTLNRLVGDREGDFGAVLCHIGQADIELWFISRAKDDSATAVLDHRTIPDWRRSELLNPTELQRNPAPVKYRNPNSMVSKIKSKLGI